jgi:hypothetical protein
MAQRVGKGARYAAIVAMSTIASTCATAHSNPDVVVAVAPRFVPPLIKPPRVVEAPVARAETALPNRVAAEVTEPSRPKVSFFGRPGSFGTVGKQGDSAVAAAVPVEGWGLLPGQASFFAAVDAKGRVLIANEPQTDNQTRPTATTKVISVFDPTSKQFNNIVIPTSKGALSTVAMDGSGVGGSDVSDMQIVDSPEGQQLVTVSVAPYNGWDSNEQGVYGTLTVLSDTGGSWAPKLEVTAAHLRASSDAGARVCERNLQSFYATVPDCGGLAEIELLPRSGLLVATRYFGEGAALPNGALVVFGRDGTVVADFAFPSVNVDGTRLRVHPREVDVDPTSTINDERFLVIFDVEPVGGEPQPFVAQEFRFDDSTGMISAVSAPFTTGGVVDGVRLGVETASYDHDGNLWIAEARSNTFQGGRIVRYNPSVGRASLASTCAATPGHPADRWGSACVPDFASEVTSNSGLVRSFSEDRVRHRMVAVTLAGTVAVVSSQGGVIAFEMPLGQLVDRNRFAIGPRQGAVSPDSATLWIPIQQLQSAAVCPVARCAPRILDQWLAGIDLSSI